MSRTLTLLSLVMLVVCLASFALAASDAEEQRQAAMKFLRAYFVSDLDVVNDNVPDEFKNMIGPFPFKGKVRFGQPKVDENQALVEFNGTPLDPKFPSHGGILFRGRHGIWRVRQVLFYDNIPRLFNLPTKSTSSNDKMFEPRVKKVCDAFMDAWEKGDYDRMYANWYDWTEVDKKRVKGLEISEIALTPGSTVWRDPYIQYTAKLSYKWGVLSYTMAVKGGLVMTKEDKEWKVRANMLVFDF